MVRTLDFHSKNVGSIPAGLNIPTYFLNNNTQTKYNHRHALSIKAVSKPKRYLRPELRYAFKFASIIPPSTLSNVTLLVNSNRNALKLQVKQSYIILTWMLYIREDVKKKQKEQQLDGQEDTSKKAPGFFIFPLKSTKQTYLKAPMAHKTFSQEQYVYNYYTLSISFRSAFRHNATVNSTNGSIYTALLLRNSFEPLETNLFFLKKFRFSFTSSCSKLLHLKHT